MEGCERLLVDTYALTQVRTTQVHSCFHFCAEGCVKGFLVDTYALTQVRTYAGTFVFFHFCAEGREKGE